MKISLLAILGLIAAGMVFWRSSQPEIVQVHAPVALREASKCPISLPRNAKNIYFAYYSDHPVYQSFVRFEIPYEEGIAHVASVFRNHAEAMQWPFRMPQQRVISSKQELTVHPLPELQVNWFDIDKIRNGLTFGELNSWQPQIWIDKDRNLFYFCVTD